MRYIKRDTYGSADECNGLPFHCWLKHLDDASSVPGRTVEESRAQHILDHFASPRAATVLLRENCQTRIESKSAGPYRCTAILPVREVFTGQCQLHNGLVEVFGMRYLGFIAGCQFFLVVHLPYSILSNGFDASSSS